MGEGVGLERGDEGGPSDWREGQRRGRPGPCCPAGRSCRTGCRRPRCIPLRCCSGSACTQQVAPVRPDIRTGRGEHERATVTAQACRSGPAFRAAMKPDQAVALKARTGPLRSLVSRTSTASPTNRTSTQCGVVRTAGGLEPALVGGGVEEGHVISLAIRRIRASDSVRA